MLRRLLTVFTLAFAMAAPAAAHDAIRLPVEHAEVVRLPAEASAVIVGNPSIADALVHDGRTLILTGRLQGRTNVIALDRVGRVIYSRDVAVTIGEGHVALYRGSNRYTLACAPNCDDVPRVGDETTRTTNMSRDQDDRLGVATTAVDASGSPD
jgi:uncharacterized protein with PhoU and TrkA domain